MKSQHFLDWMDRCGIRYATDVGTELGLSRETARKMVEAAKAGQDVPMKRTVSLAMTALANSLKPWDQYER